MDTFFKQFDVDMDSEFLNTINEIEKLNKELKFDKVPDGKYKVEVQYMSIKTSKKGNLMLQVGFQIEEGQYEKNTVWAFFLLSNINNVNSFLMSLNSGIAIKYDDLEQYKNLVEDVLSSVKGWYIYDLQISTGYTGFTTYKITGSKEKEIDLPFS